MLHLLAVRPILRPLVLCVAGTAGGRHSRNPSTSSIDASKVRMHPECAECSLGTRSCPAAALLLQLDSSCVYQCTPASLCLQEAVHKRTASGGSMMGGGAPPADGSSGGGGSSSSIFHRVSSIKNMLTGQGSK